MEWKEYKLGDVIIPINKKIDTSLIDVDNYISTENMMPDKSGVTKSSGVPSGYAIEFSKGDILISNIRPYFKKIWMADKYGGCSSDVICYRANELIIPSYLYYLLSQDVFFEYVMSGAKGTKMPRGDRQQILRWHLYLPSLEYQKRISSILKSLDDKIENNRRINENLEQQAQALFKSWFVDFEPFRDQPFVDSELGMIPEGWRVDSLDNLSSFISRGLSPKYKDDTDQWVLGQTCVRNNIVTLTNARTHEPKAKSEKKVKQWDTLINSTGIGSLGRVGIVYFDKDNISFDSHLTVVRAKEDLYKHYIGRNLLMRQLEIENMAVGSTGQTELPKDCVKSMQLIVPDKKTVERFNSIIEPIALRMYHTYEENISLAQLRDTLLPKLMSGEINLDNI